MLKAIFEKYVFYFVAIIMALLLALVLYQKYHLMNQENDLAKLTSAVVDQNRIIKNQENALVMQQTSIEAMQSAMTVLNERNAEIMATARDKKQQKKDSAENENVKAWLDSRIPDALHGLFTSPAATGGSDHN